MPPKRILPASKETLKKRRSRKEDTKARKKFARGGQIEAYTFGEALRGNRWP